MITLPQNLQAFIVIFSNPAIMAVGLSIAIEHIPFIENPRVSDLFKISFTLVVAFLWAALATLLTSGLPLTPDQWYGFVVLGLGVAMSMNIYNKLVDTAIPWLNDLLVALFGKPSTPITTITTNTVNATPVDTVGTTESEVG